jgi:hypothetical protein
LTIWLLLVAVVAAALNLINMLLVAAVRAALEQARRSR